MFPRYQKFSRCKFVEFRMDDGRIRKFKSLHAHRLAIKSSIFITVYCRGIKDGVTSDGLSRRLSRARPLYRLPCNRLLQHTNEKKIQENLPNNTNSAMSCHLIRAIETLLPRCTSWKLSCFLYSRRRVGTSI